MEDITVINNILLVLSAYVLGSIPTAVWIGKLFYSIDVRDYGSGNAGATNTFRTLGKKAGIPVLFLDILKGWAAVFLLPLFSNYSFYSDQHVNLQLAMGISVVMGHIFPVFAGFRGGKGVATLLGVVIALHWLAALICIGIFMIVFIISRYVSLGAIVSAIAFPVLIILIFKADTPAMRYFSIAFAVLVLITHQKNIERLVRNEENKMKITFKNRND